jgi:hypothetical protein
MCGRRNLADLQEPARRWSLVPGRPASASPRGPGREVRTARRGWSRAAQHAGRALSILGKAAVIPVSLPRKGTNAGAGHRRGNARLGPQLPVDVQVAVIDDRHAVLGQRLISRAAALDRLGSRLDCPSGQIRTLCPGRDRAVGAPCGAFGMPGAGNGWSVVRRSISSTTPAASSSRILRSRT